MAKENAIFDYEADERESDGLNENEVCGEDLTDDKDEGGSTSCFNEVVGHICEGIQDFFGGIADFIDDIAIKFF
jgi:hypothetical protein